MVHVRRLVGPLLLLLLLLCAAAPAAAQEKSYTYREIAVAVTVSPDGILAVTETLTYAFTGGPFRHGVRAIPFARLDDIRAVRVSELDRPYENVAGASEPGTFAATRTAEGLTIDWYFEPTSDADRTFVISYEVVGAVRHESQGNTIWWSAVFPDHSVPVERSQATFTFPPGAAINLSQVSAIGASATISVSGPQVFLRRDEPLEPGTPLEARIALPSGLIEAPLSDWQSRQAASADQPLAAAETPTQSAKSSDTGWYLTLAMFGAMGALLLFVFGKIIRLNVSNRRRPQQPAARWNAAPKPKRQSQQRASAQRHRSQRRNDDTAYVSSYDSSSNWSSYDSGSSWNSYDSGSSWSSSDSGSSYDSGSSSDSSGGGSGGAD